MRYFVGGESKQQTGQKAPKPGNTLKQEGGKLIVCDMQRKVVVGGHFQELKPKNNL